MKLHHYVLLVSVAVTGCGDEGGGGLAIAPSDALAAVDVSSVSDGGNLDASDDGHLDATDSEAPDAATPVDSVSVVDTQADVATSPAADAGPPPSELGGGVLLGEVDSSLFNLAVAAARFTQPVPEQSAGSVHGPCRVRIASPPGDEATDYGYDAGIITVSSNPEVVLTPTSEGALGTGYRSSLPADQANLLGPGGSLLPIAGAGGADIGPFSMVIQLPEPVTLIAPSTGLSATWDVADDLVVRWNAGTGETVLVTLSPLSATGQPVTGPTALCLLHEDSGSVTVPASALTAVLAGAGSRSTALGVTRTRTSSTTANGIRVPATATRSTGGLLKLSD